MEVSPAIYQHKTGNLEEWIGKLPRELKGHRHQVGNFVKYVFDCSDVLCLEKKKHPCIFLCVLHNFRLVVSPARGRTPSTGSMKSATEVPMSWGWLVVFSVFCASDISQIGELKALSKKKEIHLNLINGKCTGIHKWILFPI